MFDTCILHEMTPRLSGHFSTLVWFSLCSVLFWELRDNGVEKILTLKRRSHVRILIYQTWAIELARQPGASSLLTQLVRALQRYRRGMGSKPGIPEFFQAFFSQLHKLRF